MYNSLKVATAIPCYKVEQTLEQVVQGLPAFVDCIVLTTARPTAPRPSLTSWHPATPVSSPFTTRRTWALEEQ